MSIRIGRILALVCLFLFTSAPIVTAQSSVQLLTSPWRLLVPRNGASEKYQTINPNALMGMNMMQITYDLHGKFVLGGDASAIILNQNGWHFVSLSNYGQNGYTGQQTVNIPLSDFPGLNLSQPLDSGNDQLHTRFWFNRAITIDITNITVYYQPPVAPTGVPTSTPTNTAIPTQTIVPTATFTATPVPTQVFVPTAIPTNTAVPTQVPTVIPTSTPPPPSGSGISLLSAPWQLDIYYGSAELYQPISSTVLQGKSFIRVTYNLHGLWILGGDASAIIFDQNGWRYVSLSDYGQNGYDGWQVVDIPLSDFGLNLNQGVGLLHTRFWADADHTVDIASIVVYGSVPTPLPTLTTQPTATFTAVPSATFTPAATVPPTLTPWPTMTSTPQGQPTYPDAQSGNGIHWLIFCSKFGLPEYNAGNDLTWGCGGVTYDHQTVCQLIWGDARQYPHYANTTALGYLTCESTPQQSVPIGIPPRSTNPYQCYVTEQSWTPMQGGYITPGTQIDVWFRVARCDGPSQSPVPRAVKAKIDGISYGETAQNSMSFSVNTSNWWAGTTHEICITGASHGDEQWERAALECQQFHMLNPGEQPPADPGFSCPGAMPSLIRVGNIGVVNTVSSSPINVRHDHSTLFAVKFTMQPSQTFTVVNGPSCTAQQIWWEVCNNNGNCGWASEASGTTYSFVPNGYALPYGSSSSGSVPTAVPPPQNQYPAGSWTPIVLQTAPFIEGAPFTEITCLSPSANERYSDHLRPTTPIGRLDMILQNYNSGFFYEDAGCNTQDGNFQLVAGSWGGREGVQTFDTYVQWQGKYLPNYTGKMSIDVTILAPTRAGAAPTMWKVLMPDLNIWNQAKGSAVSLFEAAMNIPGLSELYDILEGAPDVIAGSRAFVGGQYYLRIRSGGADVGLDYYQPLGAPQMGASAPSASGAYFFSRSGEMITLSTVFDVVAGQVITIQVGESISGTAYGPALSYWWQQSVPVQITNVALFKLN